MIFFEKFAHRTKNLVGQRFSCLSTIYTKWDQKGETKKWKNVLRSLQSADTFCQLSLAHYESDAKNNVCKSVKWKYATNLNSKINGWNDHRILNNRASRWKNKVATRLYKCSVIKIRECRIPLLRKLVKID